MVKSNDQTIRLNGDSTEQKILRAAREEFIANGLRGARMQAIADRAEVNKALLHYYFRSKERLYEAALQDVLRTLGSALRARLVLERAAGDARSLLRLIVTVYIRTLQANPDFPRFMIRELADGGSRLPIMVETFISGFGDVPKLIYEQFMNEVKQGVMRPVSPVHLALNIVSMCVFTFIARPILAIVHDRGALEASYDDSFFTERIDAIVTMVCDGIFREKKS